MQTQLVFAVRRDLRNLRYNCIVMKKFFYTFLPICLLTLSYNNGQAQSFVTEKDTVRVVVDNDMDIHNNITNTTSSSIKLDWKVTDHDFPASWSDAARLGICDNNTCHNNTSGQITNGTLFTSANYAPNVKGDFHIQLLDYANSAVSSGTHYMKINLAVNGGIYSKDIVFIITKWGTGIYNVEKEDNVVLYPNPARGTLNINYGKDLSVKYIAVYNLVGKQISSYQVTSNESAQLDIETIPQGIYFVRLIDNTGRVICTRRFTHQ